MFGGEAFGSQSFGSTGGDPFTADTGKSPTPGAVIDDLCTTPAVTGETIDEACDC